MSENITRIDGSLTQKIVLAEQLGPGYHTFDGPYNKLEYAWLEAQEEDNLELPPQSDEVTQLGGAIEEIVAPFGVNRGILRARLKRIRTADLAASPGVELVDGISGGFDTQTGRIYLHDDETGTPKSHILAHEIAHGLATSGGLNVIDGTPHATGNGLSQVVASNGVKLPEALREKLETINEAVIDTVAVAASGLELDGYAKDYKGYSMLVRDLLRVSEVDPAVFELMLRHTFGNGIRNFDEGYDIVKRFSRVIPAMKLPDLSTKE